MRCSKTYSWKIKWIATLFKMKAKVSIILPVHNSMPHLDAAVRSLYESTNFPFELIIVESESKDGTREYLRELTKTKDNVRVFHMRKRGLPAAINFGIKKAEGDVYLTQDDVIHFRLYGRDWLADMYDAAKNKKVGLVTSLHGWGVSGIEYLDNFRWVGTWSCYIPRRTIKKVGLFDENMGPGDDIDYSYRVWKEGLKFVCVAFWVQHHRLTEHGSVDKSWMILKNAEYFRRKHGIDGNTNKHKG